MLVLTIDEEGNVCNSEHVKGLSLLTDSVIRMENYVEMGKIGPAEEEVKMTRPKMVDAMTTTELTPHW